MVILDNIPIEEAAQGFAAIGSEARLQVLQTLVKAGPPGLTVGDIQSRTGMAASTLAHHLRFLASAGLITQEKEGRSVISRADYDRLETLAEFILKECCSDACKGEDT
ncbi:ArsR/SmtB family transcription factor [Oricola thermophila]|uniref:Helix-turn-helix transcriptional regulator n=1 Tax=Oricola thermophila TaxID=2742145 RepID=A0A6N1VI01_9HYPH|nr:helix-turn-helix transcriptional regulator [Oricola thermophila]